MFLGIVCAADVHTHTLSLSHTHTHNRVTSHTWAIAAIQAPDGLGKRENALVALVLDAVAREVRSLVEAILTAFVSRTGSSIDQKERRTC